MKKPEIKHIAAMTRNPPRYKKVFIKALLIINIRIRPFMNTILSELIIEKDFLA